MKFKKGTLLLALMLMLSLFLAACGGGEDTTEEKPAGEENKEEQPAETETEDVEQVFNFINGDRIPSMDSSKATDEYGFQFLGATMEGLYRLGPNQELEEGIAYDHEVSEDGLVYTFHLREDAQWTNGDPVTAHDFVYAWRRAVDPNTGSEYGPYMMSGVIKNAEAVSKGELPVEELGVKAVDDYTFEVTLENPTPYFESLTTFGTFLPLNQEFVEAQGDQYATSTETLLFNGPFTLENWTSTSDSWELVKNPTYWDADTVKLEKMTYQVSKEVQTNIDLYEKGQIDRTGLSSDYVDQYITHEDYTIQPDTAVFYLKLNQKRGGTEATPLANVNIRKAISMAFNKEDLVNVLLNNGSIAANGLIPAEFVTIPATGEDFRATNGDLSVFNPDEAKEYWEKGLEELGVDSIELNFLAGDSETAMNINEYLKNQLETNLPGLTVNLQPVPFEQRLDLDTAQEYDIQMAGWGPDYLDPYTFLSLWVTDGGNNKMSYSNPEYDRLLQEAQTTYALDQEKRYENFLEAEKILFEDAAIAPLYQRASAMLVSPKVQGVHVNPFGATYEYKWAYAAPVEE